jgi:hypothetical protein
MIWTLRVECKFGRYLADECIRVIEISSDASLLELHDVIQDAVGFDRDHLIEFFVGRHYRNRTVTFAGDLDGEEAFDAYANISLEQVYPLPKGLRLFYHFDFGDDWYFEIRKSRKQPTEPVAGVEYPRVIERVGPNPEQYPGGE